MANSASLYLPQKASREDPENICWNDGKPSCTSCPLATHCLQPSTPKGEWLWSLQWTRAKESWCHSSSSLAVIVMMKKSPEVSKCFLTYACKHRLSWGEGSPRAGTPEWLGWPAGSQALEICPRLRDSLFMAKEALPLHWRIMRLYHVLFTSPMMWFLIHNCPFSCFVQFLPDPSLRMLRKCRQ